MTDSEQDKKPEIRKSKDGKTPILVKRIGVPRVKKPTKKE